MTPIAKATVALVACLAVLSFTPLPTTLSDREFRGLVTELSEPSGVFAPQLMGNEDSAQFVIPALTGASQSGGVYIGVGSEQNFTYLAATRPQMAFIVDIRRDNMLEHLMYKAIFELATDRADFVSRLFSRTRPSGVDSGSSAAALFEAYRAVPADAALYARNTAAVLTQLVERHGFGLPEADRAAIARFMDAFRAAGPDSLKGYGDGSMLTYAQLMAATDLGGRPHSYLASEENFKIVQDLERRNLIVPLVGDFAGDKALAGVGTYLEAHNAIVNVFYLSNVERYLFEQGPHGRQFYANVATLPRNSSSIFIRAVTTDISRRLGIPIPDGPERWRTFLAPINDCLSAIASGDIQTYADLFKVVR